jgi:hypothetical protein
MVILRYSEGSGLSAQISQMLRSTSAWQSGMLLGTFNGGDAV